MSTKVRHVRLFAGSRGGSSAGCCRSWGAVHGERCRKHEKRIAIVPRAWLRKVARLRSARIKSRVRPLLVRDRGDGLSTRIDRRLNENEIEYLNRTVYHKGPSLSTTPGWQYLVSIAYPARILPTASSQWSSNQILPPCHHNSH